MYIYVCIICSAIRVPIDDSATKADDEERHSHCCSSSLLRRDWRRYCETNRRPSFVGSLHKKTTNNELRHCIVVLTYNCTTSAVSQTILGIHFSLSPFPNRLPVGRHPTSF